MLRLQTSYDNILSFFSYIMSLFNTIQSFKKNELLAHVELDDVIIKVSQELLEMLEAKLNGNEEELKKETFDTVVNVLSASAEV